MAKKRPNSSAPAPAEIYWGADVSMRIIRRFARAVAEKFQPDKIILFGSHAYGTPNADSDVDILVVMPARNQRSQAYKICLAIPAPFPMDLIVRTPDTLKWRLEEGDSFLREIVSKGKVLYEKAHEGVGAKSRSRLSGGGEARSRAEPLHDAVTFHCQQSVEKYLKALLEELGLSVPRTHDPERLRILLVPHHPSLRSLRRGLMFLRRFSVDTRYPGDSASKREAAASLRWADRVRTAARTLLGIRPPRTRPRTSRPALTRRTWSPPRNPRSA
jgi:HEPN domain-containing protein/predicted nucleotidyltransferase